MSAKTLISRFLVSASVVAALAAIPSSASAAVFNSPLDGYWPMIKSAQKVIDISGAGNNGVIGHTTQSDRWDPNWVPGLFGIGNALRFDGNDYVEVPDTGSLSPKRVTLEAWARADKSPGQYKYIASKGGRTCRSGSFGLYSSINGGAAFYVYDGTRWHRSPMVSPKVWDGQWHHFAGTYDGKKVRLYVDGSEIGTGTTFTGEIDYDLPNRLFYIGAYRGSCDLTMEGDIDEVRLWDRALSVDTIWNTIRGFLTQEPAAPGLPEDAGDWTTVG